MNACPGARASRAAAGRPASIEPGAEPASLLSLQYPLSRLTEDERGNVLERVSEAGGYRYRFRHHMMRQYVLMRQARERQLI